MSKTIDIMLHVWRQKNAADPGRFVDYPAKGISTEMSFLEMLDVVNEDLIHKGGDPIVFDHDCREGICGACAASRTAPASPSSRCGPRRSRW